MTSFAMIRKTLVAAALVVSAASAQAASYDIYNDFGGWLASVDAMGPPATFGTGTFQCANPGPNCDNPAVNGLPGVSYSQVGPGSASLDAGDLLNNLGVGGYLEWSFATPQNGWGGTFRMTTGNGVAFQALDLNLGWIDVTSVSSGQELDGFLGFSSTDRFSGVRVSNSDNPTSSYRMSDVSIARANVPEPASLALLGLGLAGLGLARRRKA